MSMRRTNSSSLSSNTSVSSSQSNRLPNIYDNSYDNNKTIIKWKKAEILGQGAFGVVSLGLNIDTGELMAVKQMKIDEVSKKELSILNNEINLLKTLRHNNIVRYIGTEISSTHLSIFLEYIPGGSIKSLLNKFGALDESVVRSYTRQLLYGLEYLHSNGIAHRDIKGANCLVGNDGVVKLADFGNSKKWRNTTGIVTTESMTTSDITGTPCWMAPEVIRNNSSLPTNDVNIPWKKADVWSLACTSLEMVSGKPPWSQFTNPVTILYNIACLDNSFPEFPSNISNELLSFLNICINKNASLRPDVSSLLLHPFVTAGSVNSNPGFILRPSTVSTGMIESNGRSGSNASLFGNRQVSSVNNNPVVTIQSNEQIVESTTPDTVANVENNYISSCSNSIADDDENSINSDVTFDLYRPGDNPLSNNNSSSIPPINSRSNNSNNNTSPLMNSMNRHLDSFNIDRLLDSEDIQSEYNSDNDSTISSVSGNVKSIKEDESLTLLPRVLSQGYIDDYEAIDEPNDITTQPNIEIIKIENTTVVDSKPTSGNSLNNNKIKSNKISKYTKSTIKSTKTAAPITSTLPTTITNKINRTNKQSTTNIRSSSNNVRSSNSPLVMISKDLDDSLSITSLTNDNNILPQFALSPNSKSSPTSASFNPRPLFTRSSSLNTKKTTDSNNNNNDISLDSLKITGINYQNPTVFPTVHTANSDQSDDDIFLTNRSSNIINSLSNEQLVILEEHKFSVTRLRYPSKWPSLLVSSSLDGTIKLWDGNNNESRYTLDVSNFNTQINNKNDRKILIDSKKNDDTSLSNRNIGVVNVWCDNSCENIWGAYSDNYIRVWNGVEGRPIRILKGHDDNITTMEGLSNNPTSLVATGSSDRSIRIWDGRAKRPQIFLFKGHTDSIQALRWGDDGGRTIISASKDKTIRLWDIKAGRLRNTIEKHFSAVNSIRLNPSIGNNNSDKALFVSAGRDSMIHLWSNSGECVSSLTGHRGNIHFISEIHSNISSIVNSKVSLMLSLGSDNMKVWDISKMKCVSDISYNSPNNNLLSKAVWLMNSSNFITSSTLGQIKLWTNPNNDNDWKSQDLTSHTQGCTDLMTTNSYIASSSKSGQILRWNFI